MYKKYNLIQIKLPMDLEVLILANNISMAMYHLAESIPNIAFENFVTNQGASAHHPKMMLKILLCAYSHSEFSGRKIVALLHVSIRMIWLAQEHTPSYRPINRFRVHPQMAALL